MNKATLPAIHPVRKQTTSARAPAPRTSAAAKPAAPAPKPLAARRPTPAAKRASGTKPTPTVAPSKPTPAEKPAASKASDLPPASEPQQAVEAPATAPDTAVAVPEKSAEENAAEPEAIRQEEEARRLREEEAQREFARRNGDVTVCYNHYKKQLRLKDGTLTSDAVDDELALTFAFPNCKLHLTPTAPDPTRESGPAPPLIDEAPPGVFVGLETGSILWVVVEEDLEEERKAEERQRQYVERMTKERNAKAQKDNGIKVEREESCSCVEGNPCLSQYSCKDWENRYEVAKRHGWKGFQ
eukprot:TRINITY_DN19332_c0_g1_i1.p1 TRINITY_DN19332_c0_g1~~TRINITY_DN19332_c0_g1_i1.p1  ORF type:complete len:299 (-),score=30.36 TRINITY_DN19332_c0_g1_i1:22-918(-)